MGVTKEMKEESWSSIFDLDFLEAAPGSTTKLQGDIMDSLDKLKNANSLRYVDVFVLENIVRGAYELGRSTMAAEQNLPVDGSSWIVDESHGKRESSAWNLLVEENGIEISREISEGFGTVLLAQTQDGRKLTMDFSGQFAGGRFVPLYKSQVPGRPDVIDDSLFKAITGFIS